MKFGLLPLSLVCSVALFSACAPEETSGSSDGKASKSKQSRHSADDDDDSATSKTKTPDAPVPEEPAVEPLAFTPCTKPYTGSCAKVDLPVDRTKPDGDTVPIFVTKFADPPNPRGSLWLLQGGPGGSVSAFESVVGAYRNQFPDLTIYGLEHRGVGRSTRLEDCVDDDCFAKLEAKWGDKLGHFSTTEAAQDLHEVIRRTRRAEEPVFVYGVSYGTYWAQRYLTMFPTEPAGVVLDSVVPMRGLYFSGSDAEGGSVARHWANLCEDDATCNAKFGGSVWTKLQAAFAKFGSAKCSGAGLTRDHLTKLRGLLASNEFGFAILPVAYRFERCNAGDVAFLQQFFANVDAFQSEGFSMPRKDVDDEDQNGTLYFNVAFSELWELPAPSAMEMTRRFQSAVLPSGSIVELAEFQAMWPKYAHDEFVGKYPNTSVPVLVMNGTLDSQTPYDLVSGIAEYYKKPHQQFVTIKNGNHGLAYPRDSIPCGLTVMKSFLTSPTATLDTSCTATPEEVSLVGIPTYNQAYFGATDLWEGKITPASVRFTPAQLADIAAFEDRQRMLGHSMRSLLTH